jgi:hypothetical protein
MGYLERAIDFIRENIDEHELMHKLLDAKMMGCSFSNAYPADADDLQDILEEFGADNDLPEGWWCEYGVIEDIVEMI